MKRALLLLVAAALAVGGCGKSPGAEKRALDPRAEVVRFFPAGAQVVALVNTDATIDDLRRLARTAEPIPGFRALRDRAARIVRASGLNVQREIAPLLGKQLAIGAGSLADLAAGRPLLALETGDPPQLNHVARRAVAAGGLREAGRYHGARLFSADGAAVATRDGVLLIGADADQLRKALDVRDGVESGRLNDDDVTALLDELPPEARVHVYVDLRGILDSRLSPATRRRLDRLPWVAALGQAGIAFDRTADSATLTFLVRTDRGSLQDSDLPIAPGELPPPVHRVAAGLDLGLSQAAQTRRFADRLGAALGSGSPLLSRVSDLVDRAARASGPASGQVSGAAGSLALAGHLAALFPLLPAALVDRIRGLQEVPAFSAYAAASTDDVRGRIELHRPGVAP